MGGYKLPHSLAGEEKRLALMSTLLDPIELASIARLGVRQGWHCLELGCGNGSISLALAERVAPTGVVVASDIDLSYVSRLEAPCLKVRRIDVLQDSVEADIDYFFGRKIPSCLDSLGMQDIAGEGYTANFNGGSDWADYWILTMRKLAPSLLKSGYIAQELLEEFEACYQDPHYWTSVITFTATWGRKPL